MLFYHCLYFLKHGLHASQTVIDQIPGAGIQKNNMAILGSFGLFDQVIVQYLACTAITFGNRSTAVNHKQIVRIFFSNKFMRYRHAMCPHLDTWVRWLEAVQVMNQAKT